MSQPAEENGAGLTQPSSSPVHLHSPSATLSEPHVTNGPQSLKTTKPAISSSASLIRPSSYSSADSRAPSHERSRSPSLSRLGGARLLNSGCRNLIVRSFAPTVAVHASPDVEDFIRGKGIATCLSGLLRPFGEHVQGKVIIRDSIGLSKAWEDFGIRFVGPPSALGEQNVVASAGRERSVHRSSLDMTDEPSILPTLDEIEELLGQYMDTQDWAHFSFNQTSGKPSQLFIEYIRSLLSSSQMVPQETFCHPVACLVAVSSRSQAPIEVLRQLYAQTGRGNPNIPAWVGVEYLRYYILIHDDDNDDIARSTALFDLMKRHFGLHCHLLRLRSSQCVPSDDDSYRVPTCEWLSASERLRQARIDGDTDSIGQCIFESDASAITSLIREMVTQSIVPFMESRVVTWNDQVASRRRGLGGRFMSMSKRWAGFGSSKANSSNASSSSNSNYNSQLGYYPPESPEIIMRQMADYSIMLRDYKLSHSTYDALRSDFAHDKAWTYHSAANESAAISSLLLTPQQSRSRSETIDSFLEAATYSYLTRSSSPTGAIRCLTLATELLFHRDPPAADHAAKWAGRLLELSILSPIAQVLTAERMADYYTSKIHHTAAKADRARQAGLWNVTAASSWARLGRSSQAESRVVAASKLFKISSVESSGLPFPSMRPLWTGLLEAVGNVHLVNESGELDGEEAGAGFSSVQEEQLDAFVSRSDPLRTDLNSWDPVEPLKHHVKTSHQRHASTLSMADSDGFE